MRWPVDRIRQLHERVHRATTPAARSAAMQRCERILARLHRLAPRHVRPPADLGAWRTSAAADRQSITRAS
jgi:hypothetical protein